MFNHKILFVFFSVCILLFEIEGGRLNEREERGSERGVCVRKREREGGGKAIPAIDETDTLNPR